MVLPPVFIMYLTDYNKYLYVVFLMLDHHSIRQRTRVTSVCLCFLSVNNAGVGLLGPVESISIEEMKRVFDTNFFGVVRMIKEVMPDMKKRRSGHIVVMSSVMGLQGTTFQVFEDPL